MMVKLAITTSAALSNRTVTQAITFYAKQLNDKQAEKLIK